MSRTVADHLKVQAEYYARSIQSKANDLRALADSLDRAASHVSTVTDGKAVFEYSGTYAYVAATVQHSVVTALFNLNLDELTTNAYVLDEMRNNPAKFEYPGERPA